MIEQDIFDKVASHLLTQMEKLMDKNGDNCLYVSPLG